jgi:hypothetical protein
MTHDILLGEWCGATWPSHGIPHGTHSLVDLLIVFKKIMAGPWGSNMRPPWVTKSSHRLGYHPAYMVDLTPIPHQIYLSLDDGHIGGE